MTLVKLVNERNVFCQRFCQCQQEYLQLCTSEKCTKWWIRMNNKKHCKCKVFTEVSLTTCFQMICGQAIAGLGFFGIFFFLAFALR